MSSAAFWRTYTNNLRAAAIFYQSDNHHAQSRSDNTSSIQHQLYTGTRHESAIFSLTAVHRISRFSVILVLAVDCESPKTPSPRSRARPSLRLPAGALEAT
jgi:hypothetical protein